MNTYIIIGLCLFIYINIGHLISTISWKRYGPFKESKKFNVIDFLLWPTSSLINIDRIDSNDCEPLINLFTKDTYYILITTPLWPLRVIFNVFIMIVLAVILIMMISLRIFATSYIVMINTLTINKKIYTGDLIKKIWKKRLIIKHIF